MKFAIARSLVCLAAASVIVHCDLQAEPDYPGEALAVITGTLKGAISSEVEGIALLRFCCAAASVAGRGRDR